MNVAFTIVAKNYLSLAFTLADNIKKYDSQLPFYILLADIPEGLSEEYFTRYNIVVAHETNTPHFEQMAFKYDVTEFCTVIKPFFIDQLFDKGYEKVIYFDPDIYLYSSPEIIFNELNDCLILITPHILTIEESFTGALPEKELLFSGIYNLGFIAVKKSQQVKKFIGWWKRRLADLGYGDRMESLHVDQKWIDFLPVFFDKELRILRHPGYNIAYWNMHERQITANDQMTSVTLASEVNQKYPLIFLHFSGFDPNNIQVNRQCPSLNVDLYPVWKDFARNYAEDLKGHGFDELRKLKYTYSNFANGEVIAPFHRRMYRKLLEISKEPFLEHPFATGEKTYYHVLKKNNLLLDKAVIETKITKENIERSTEKLRKMNFLLRMLKKITGLKNYITLLRFCQKYFRPENQIFLMKEFRNHNDDNYFNA